MSTAREQAASGLGRSRDRPSAGPSLVGRPCELPHRRRRPRGSTLRRTRKEDGRWTTIGRCLALATLVSWAAHSTGRRRRPAARADDRPRADLGLGAVVGRLHGRPVPRRLLRHAGRRRHRRRRSLRLRAKADSTWRSTRCMQTSQGAPDPAALVAEPGPRRRGRHRPADEPRRRSGLRLHRHRRPHCAAAGGGRACRVLRARRRPARERPLDAAVPAGHGFVTEDGPVPCADGDAVRQRLRPRPGPRHPGAVYGALNPPAADGRATGRAFDQTAYLPSPRAAAWPRPAGSTCRRAAPRATTCRVHIAFHGCKQNEALVGDAFTVGAGFNRWAETNGIVVLYPQAQDGLGNPNGCWDWWGYTDQPTRPRAASRWQPFTGCCWRWRARPATAPSAAFCARHDAWNAAPLERRPGRGVRPRLCLCRRLGRRARPAVRRQHRLRAPAGLLYRRSLPGVRADPLIWLDRGRIAPVRTGSPYSDEHST